MSPPASDLLADDRIPICIGVTGHRDLRPEDVPRLEAAVEAELGAIVARYPYSPVVLLSPLAEGADRLATRAALRVGAQLVVPLPTERAIYTRGFGSDASREEFDALLARAAFCVTLPPVAGEAEQYRQLGAWVVQHTHTLLALWDGRPADKPGGTGDVVAMKREGPPAPWAAPRSPLDPPELGRIVHVVTPRGATAVDEAGRVHIDHPPHPAGEAVARHEADSALAHIDRANRDTLEVLSDREAAMRVQTEHVVPEGDTALLSDAEALLLRRFGVLDALAVHCQRRRRQTWIWLFAMVLAAYGAFEVYDNLLLGQVEVGLLYPAILLAAFLTFRLISRYDHHTRHLDYRTLAEGLRVQLFWRIAGVEEQVCDRYLRKQGGELQWIREAIRGCNLLPHAAPADAPPLARCALVARRWVRDQEGYFGRATRIHERGLRRLGGVSQALYFASIALTLSVIGLDVAHGLREFALPVDVGTLRGSVFVAIGLSLALSAAIQGYAEKMVLAEEAKQYDRMHAVLRRATAGLSARIEAGDLAAARDLIRELGDEALQENGDWVILHRTREIQLPSG